MGLSHPPGWDNISSDVKIGGYSCLKSEKSLFQIEISLILIGISLFQIEISLILLGISPISNRDISNLYFK